MYWSCSGLGMLGVWMTLVYNCFLNRTPAAIIGTHQEKNGALFWSIVTKLQLQGHPIVCWKFAHLLHKVLREGHPQVRSKRVTLYYFLPCRILLLIGYVWKGSDNSSNKRVLIRCFIWWWRKEWHFLHSQLLCLFIILFLYTGNCN